MELVKDGVEPNRMLLYTSNREREHEVLIVDTGIVLDNRYDDLILLRMLAAGPPSDLNSLHLCLLFGLVGLS